MKARIDKDACAGCGGCVEICPLVFEMEADGKAGVKVSSVPPEAEAACRAAADQCPTSAILLE